MLLDSLHQTLFTTVKFTLVAKNQHGRGHGLVEILLQRLRILDILRLLDDEHLSFGHHRIALGSIHNLRCVDVRAKHNRLVEVPFLRLQHVVSNPVANLVDIIRLIARQIIDGLKLASLQLTHHAIVCYCSLCHIACKITKNRANRQRFARFFTFRYSL